MPRKIVIFALLLLLNSGSTPVKAYNNNPIQGAHQDIQSEMEELEPQILPHVEILWRYTLKRNPTLQLALQKMAEKTGQLQIKDKSEWTGRMLQGLIQLGGMGGAMAVGSPAPLIGSTVLGRMTAPDTAPSQLTAVTSADLVILAREIEQAQNHLILGYVQYRQAIDARDEIQQALDAMQSQSRQLPQDSPQTLEAFRYLLLDQSLKLQQAQNDIATYRNLLILSVGEEGVAEIDQLVNNKTEKSEFVPKDKIQPDEISPISPPGQRASSTRTAH